MAAAGGGNLLFHLMEACLYDGPTPAVLASVLRTTPYYIVLGLAIGITQIWLMQRGRRRHRPWTSLRRLPLDVMAVTATIGFFILIRPLHHIPLEHGIAASLRVLMAALGV
jgi:hypothetical protein